MINILNDDLKLEMLIFFNNKEIFGIFCIIFYSYYLDICIFFVSKKFSSFIFLVVY